MIEKGGMTSHRLPTDGAVAQPRFCVFEHVYFARPDSLVNGKSVYRAREKMGRRLAQEAPATADVVIPVPDSGVPAAIGYSKESGIPFEMGLIRSHYVGRTFIEPQDSIRHFGVRLKLSPVRSIVDGKRVVVVDDSLVRGTTSRKIVKMLRGAGAREVHLRIERTADDAPVLLRDRHAHPQRAGRGLALGRRDQPLRHERFARVPVARGHDGRGRQRERRRILLGVFHRRLSGRARRCGARAAPAPRARLAQRVPACRERAPALEVAKIDVPPTWLPARGEIIRNRIGWKPADAAARVFLDRGGQLESIER